MKAWLISDTHGQHSKLTVPKDVDLVIHAGDFTNSPNTTQNYMQFRFFLEWWKNLPIDHKIIIPGNHDVSMERLDYARQELKDCSNLLIHDTVEIAGLKFFGSPYTPKFGTVWSYNISRSKIGRKWDQIPEDTNVLITHGMPYGVMDLAVDHEDKSRIIPVGDKSLLKKIKKLADLRLYVGGHIHSNVADNAGTRRLPNYQTQFVNASVVRDGDMEIYHNGFTFNLGENNA